MIAWWYGWRDPGFIALTVPEHIIQIVEEDGELSMGSIVGVEPLASSSITINNLSVAFEDFFSPSPIIPNPIKYLVGMGW